MTKENSKLLVGITISEYVAFTYYFFPWGGQLYQNIHLTKLKNNPFVRIINDVQLQIGNLCKMNEVHVNQMQSAQTPKTEFPWGGVKEVIFFARG